MEALDIVFIWVLIFQISLSDIILFCSTNLKLSGYVRPNI